MAKKPEIPVYIFMGLLESGKTSVIQDFLDNNQFAKNECNLIIMCEEGEEELDSDIVVEEYIDTVEYDYPVFHLSMRCYFCKLISGKLTLKEAEESRWLTRDTIADVQWLPADITILDKIKKKL